MNRVKLPLLLETLLSCLLMSVLPCAGSAQRPSKVTITYPGQTIRFIDLHIAQQRGFFREEGLDAQLVLARGDVAVNGLQSLVSGAIQVVALSLPGVILARDKFKMRVLASAVEEYPSLESGIAVPERLLHEKRDLIKRIRRAGAKAHRYFWENERGSSEILADYVKVELPMALESYRLARPSFTTDGIPTEDEVREYLKMDAEIMGLPKPVPAARVFDFSVQREVNHELGVK